MSTFCQTKANKNDIDVECDIPHNLPNFTCIEYPGKIENIANAIETLGGNQKIQQTFTQYNECQTQQTGSKKEHKEPYLELHLNPNGVFDHPLFGKIRRIKNCILIKKITKINKKNPRKRKLDSIEAIGRINTFVSYDELCDFQVFSSLKYNDSKRQRLWSLREDDIPNISKYPLIPRVFASKAMPYDGFLKESQKTKEKQKTLETQSTEIRFIKKEIPLSAKKGSIWIKYINDLKEYTSNIDNRTIPNNDEAIKMDKISSHSFCWKIRNELILQIKSYFDVKPIWCKTDILLQKFYIYWYHIKYFADRIEVNHNDNEILSSDTDTFYDFDIASIVFERKQKKNFYLTALSSRNVPKKRREHDHGFRQIDKQDLDNTEKIYLDFKEKEKIISKFLGIFGYKFKNGPFRNSYIKFGFDPRDPLNKNISRSLQIIDYRINKTNGKKLGIDTIWNITGSRVGNRGKPNTQKTNKKYVLQTMQTIMNNQQINTESKYKRNERFLADEMMMDHQNKNDLLEKEIMDRLRFKIKPNKLQIYYQLKNIDITEIQNIVNDCDPNSYNDECIKDCGWIKKKDEIKIREIMNERLEEWIAAETQKKRKKTRNTSNSNSSAGSSPNINENEEEKMMELDDDDDNEVINQLYGDDDDDDVFPLL